MPGSFQVIVTRRRLCRSCTSFRSGCCDGACHRGPLPLRDSVPACRRGRNLKLIGSPAHEIVRMRHRHQLEPRARRLHAVSFGLPAVTNVSLRLCCSVICTFFASVGISLSARPAYRASACVSPAAVSYCALSPFVDHRRSCRCPGWQDSRRTCCGTCPCWGSRSPPAARRAEDLQVIEPQRRVVEVEEIVADGTVDSDLSPAARRTSLAWSSSR